MTPDLRNLSPGEEIWLARRTRFAARRATLVEYAATIGVCMTTLWRLEHGTRDPEDFALRKVSSARSPSISDYCALARRRSRLSLGRVAALMGISRVTVLAREGSPESVIFWEKRGFRFPQK